MCGWWCRRYLFAYLHPALGGTVGLKSSTVVQAKLMPHDGLWPTNQVHTATSRQPPAAAPAAPVACQCAAMPGPYLARLGPDMPRSALRCAVLCCAVPCPAAPCCDLLRPAALCRAAPYRAGHATGGASVCGCRGVAGAAPVCRRAGCGRRVRPRTPRPAAGRRRRRAPPAAAPAAAAAPASLPLRALHSGPSFPVFLLA